ncbi:MAG: hypothetical protein FJX77_11840, partial [Armatimonadetes bacterium]|nr:hypothetical protein [Armatimonadota bacterium]
MALEEPVSDISQGSLFGKMVGGIFGSRRTSAPREATGSGFASRTEMLGGSEPPSGSGDTPGPSASRLKTEQLVEGSSGARTRVPGRPNLGKILTERGVITQAQLERALEHQKESGCRLGEALEELNFCTDAQIAKALAEQLEIPFIDLEQSPPSRRFLELIPRDVALEHGVVAVRMDGNRLLVAARDPFDVRADQAIHQITGLNARLAAVPHSQLNELLLRGLREEFLGDKDDDEDEAPVTLNTFSGTAAPSYQATIQDEEVLTVEKLAQLGQQLSTVQAVDSLIAQAIRGGASDLHIKPEAEFLRIRHRVDGRLRTLVHLPSQLIPSIMARVKIMASMDISESRKPQDGSAQFGVDGRTFELRVSTLPGIYGEVAVIRVLNNDLGMRSLDGIGMDPEVEQQIRRVLGARQGMVLITGPTGSGKTTSLYASLSHLNTDEVNIITVEDPVE